MRIASARMPIIALLLLASSCREPKTGNDQPARERAAASGPARQPPGAGPPSCSARWQAAAVKRCQLLVAMASAPDSGFDQEVANEIGHLRLECPGGLPLLDVASRAAREITAAPLPQAPRAEAVLASCTARLARHMQQQPPIQAIEVGQRGRLAEPEKTVRHDHSADR